MSTYGIREASDLLNVSDDTVRRWAEAGRLSLIALPNGRMGVDGVELARVAATLAAEGQVPPAASASTRNRLPGIVTRVVRDTVMAQVEMQCGPHRVVSLLSREAADELGLEPGVRAVASIKATNVVVELPMSEHERGAQ
ncbi:MAG TPA: TOBE domain-containing protein [Mycobacteriales bacterium]|jgi:molybdopterin-binding protein|nr:TOBE domain-containing protein [Mycobacteriales bacterium]